MSFSPFLRGLGGSLRVCKHILVKHYDRAMSQTIHRCNHRCLSGLSALLDRLSPDIELSHFSKFFISIRFVSQRVELVSYLVLNELL